MSRFSRNPVSELLFHFRCTISREALNALEARDADWRRENDALREEKRKGDAVYRELLLRYQWMEEELSKQTCMNKSMKEDILRLTEKERWLHGKVRCLETDVLNSGRVKKEEVDRVSKEKAVLEAKLQEAEVQLAKQQNMIRNVDVPKKEIDDFEFALGQVEFAKNKGTLNVKALESKSEVCNVKREKISLEAERRLIEEKEKLKIKELTLRVEALEREKGEIEAELRRRGEEMKEKILQLANKCKVMEDELCNTLHEKIVSKDQISKLVSRIEVLEAEKRGLEAERRTAEGRIKALGVGKKQSKTSNQEKTQLIKILREKADMEAEKSSLESELRKVKERQQLVNKISKEKTTLEGELKKLKEEMGAKKDDSERISMLEEALKDEKNRMQEIVKQSSEISKDLKREKEALEAQVREKTEERKMILKEKMDLEAEEKRKFAVLMREKAELEAELCQANKDKSEVAKRIGLLEKEKQELETENMDKDEVIKVVAEENSSLESEIKKLNTHLSNILAIKAEDVQVSQPLYHPGNVGMLTTSWQTQAGEGKKTVGACKRKRTNVSQRKHKRHFSEGSSEGRCSRTSTGGEFEDDASKKRKSNDIWEVEEDLLIAFDSDPELCLKAVCVLYRQHSSLAAGHPVIKPSSSSKVIALARYLVSDEPDMRLKKTVADVEQLDPLALDACRDIAKLHYKELFQTYNKNKHDPSFRP